MTSAKEPTTTDLREMGQPPRPPSRALKPDPRRLRPEDNPHYPARMPRPPKPPRKRRVETTDRRGLGISRRTPLPEPPPPPVTPPTPGQALAARLTETTVLGEARTVSLILAEMTRAGAQQIPMRADLVAAIEPVAAEFITGSEGRPATRRSRKAGAQLILRALAENRQRYAEAASALQAEATSPGPGLTINIIAPPGATGMIPLPPRPGPTP